MVALHASYIYVVSFDEVMMSNFQVFLSQEHDRYGLYMFCLFVNILYATQEVFNVWVS